MLGLAGATLLSGLATAGAGLLNNKLNIDATNAMNDRQEALMRESWAREDNAVQRRVADLKAAGLSPTLAAGGAAATSGPIKLNTPQYDLDGVINRSLEAASAVKALKTQDLQNELLKKQIDNYGLPDGIIYLQNLFGDKWTDVIRGFGDKIYSWLTGGSDKPNSPASVVNNFYNSIKEGFDSGFKFAFTPKQVYTSNVAPASSEVVESVKEVGGTVTQDSDGGNIVAFESKAQAKQWFLDIGGTTAEWYQGIRDYGSPEAFLDWILGSGGWYFN